MAATAVGAVAVVGGAGIAVKGAVDIKEGIESGNGGQIENGAYEVVGGVLLTAVGAQTTYQGVKVVSSNQKSQNITADNTSKKGGKGSIKFSEMTETEITDIAEDYRNKAPINIPESAKFKAKSMPDGYEQISYKWNDGTYKYEVRWHTRTSGAPEGQGNTWVIQRTIPGNGGTKPSTQFMVGENQWVEGWKWYDAINARKNGTATLEQIELLVNGHWKE